MAAVVLLAAASPSLLYNTLFSRDFAAAWRLRTAPHPADLAEGARRGVVLLVLLPAMAALGIAAWLSWGEPGHAAAFALGTWLVVVLCSKLAAGAVFLDVPLSRPASRGGALGPIALPSAGIGAVAGTIVGIAWLIRAEPAALWGLVAATLLASELIGRSTRRTLARRLGVRP